MDAPDLTRAGGPAAAHRASTAWLGLAVRLEDWLLAGWVVLAAPLLARIGGTGGPFDSGHPVAGLLQLVGFCGAFACLATRSPDPTAGSSLRGGTQPSGARPKGASDASGSSVSRPRVLDSGVVGPLVGGLLLVGFTGFTELGLDPLALFYPTIGGVLLLSVFESRVPTVSTPVRRALVTPYLLAAGGLFWNIVHTVTAGADLRPSLDGAIAVVNSGAAGVVGLLVLGAAVYYAMLIYAPRQVAEREGGAFEWLARFALFLVSVALGLGWLALIGG